MLEDIFLSTFDRGLSTVDADDPDTSEGVLSSLGRRDDEACRTVLGAPKFGEKWVVATEGVVLPWRD